MTLKPLKKSLAVKLSGPSIPLPGHTDTNTDQAQLAHNQYPTLLDILRSNSRPIEEILLLELLMTSTE